MRHTFKKAVFAAIVAAPVLGLFPVLALADTVHVNFENPPYTIGDINGQDGWQKTGAFDVAVVANTFSIPTFGVQTLRVSDAVTSDSFGDQTFAKPLINSVGETGATAGAFSVGTKQTHYEMQFDFASTLATVQTGMHMSVSPDRGDGSRMSYLRFDDMADGVHVFFDDVEGTVPLGTDGCATTVCANFVERDIATLSRTIPHHVMLSFDAVEGPSNDVVKAVIDGATYTGTSWEDYYRFDPEASAEQSPRIIKTVLIRESGAANVIDAGKGFLIDNFSQSAGPTPTSTTVVVRPSSMMGFVFVNDTTEGPGSGTMVIGPSTPPLGVGSAQLTATTTTDGQILEKAAFLGAKFAEMTTLQYSTYQDPANPSNATAIALQFNVDKNVTDADNSFQGRIIFEPYYNNGGTVPLGAWNTWDALNSGNGIWWLSKSATLFSGNCSQATPCTLAHIIALYPNIGVHPTLGAVVLKAGSGWTSFKGNTDALTIGVNNANTTYDFEPDLGPTSVSVHIFKFIDGVGASTTVATSSFPMLTTFTSTNLGSATDAPFTLSPSPWGAGDQPYEASFNNSNPGANYATHEVTGGSVVGADCTNQPQYMLGGYKVGDTYAQALASATTTAPNFTNLQSDKYVLVLNQTCPPPQTFLKVHILKYLDGSEATASSSNNYLFPMVSSWSASNIGSGSGSYTLGNNFGGASSLYGADTAAMSAPANYATNEVTDSSSQVVASGAQCVPGKFKLVGYQVSAISFADAASSTVTASNPSFTGLTSDEYVIVRNVTCPTTASITIEKDANGDNGTFNFTSDIPGHASFSITTTGGTGSQTFLGIAPSTYHVVETAQPGWTQTDNECSSVALAAGSSTVCTVTNTKNTKLGEIRGTKYEDVYGDGKLVDRDQHRLSGWTIYLDTNNNGVLNAGEATTTTDSQGNYHFLSLPAGTYHVREVLKTGWVQTVPTSGKYDVTLSAGQIAKKKDFGNFKLGSISGIKYNDLNGNGRKNLGEPGLAGWTIKIKKGNTLVAATTTDATGHFSFPNLGPGTYQLSEVMQSGWVQTDHPGATHLESGMNDTNNEFANHFGPVKYHDRDHEDDN